MPSWLPMQMILVTNLASQSMTLKTRMRCVIMPMASSILVLLSMDVLMTPPVLEQVAIQISMTKGPLWPSAGSEIYLMAHPASRAAYAHPIRYAVSIFNCRS